MNLPDTHPLQAVVDRIVPFDPVDLLAIAGALQLIPENANRILRIQAFAHAACTLQHTQNGPRISITRLRQILNGPPLSTSIAQGEDPFPNPYVEEVSFYGGSYKVFPGTAEGSTYVLRSLCAAVFKEHALSAHITDRIARLVTGTLQLSNTIAERAGLRRGADPASTPDGTPQIPSAQDFRRLKEAVRFDIADMEGFFRPGSVDEKSWAPLTIRLGATTIGDYNPEDGPLLNSPITTFGGIFIVACPDALVSALNHHIVRLAVEDGSGSRLAEVYNRVVMASVASSLRFLDCRQITLQIPNGSALRDSGEGLFEQDSDKLIHVIVVTDDLEDFDINLPSGGMHRPTGLEERIVARFRAVEEHLFSQPRPPNDLLCMFVYGGVGRPLMMGLGNVTATAEFILLRDHDLETIAHIEFGNSLAIWRFARESRRVRERAHIIAWSTLDEYAFYRRYHHGYYSGDEAPPDLISIMPAFGRPLRSEVLHKRDWHGVPYISPGTTIDVASFFDTGDIPIYAPYPPSDDRAAFYIEDSGIPVWVVGPEGTRGTQGHEAYFEFCSTVAYWLWQALPHLRNVAPAPPINVVIHLKLPETPLAVTNSQEQGRLSEEDLIGVEVHAHANSVRLTIQPGLTSLIGIPDNSAERELLRFALRGIADLLGMPAVETVGAAFIDKVAPLGQKKMLIVFDTNNVPELDPLGMPRFRPMQVGDVDDVLERIGRYLTVEKRMECGKIPDAGRNQVLQDVVTYCFTELEARVRAQSPVGLLEFLIAHHEAVVREDAYQRIAIPGRVRCFAGIGDVVADLEEELLNMAEAALATRFLIEYVAAQPPCGWRPVSLSVLDELRATAVEIINFGMESDSVHYGLSDLQISILESGRLGRVEKRFHEAREKHIRTLTAEQISRAFGLQATDVRSEWPSGAKRPYDACELDEAAADEFGFTFTQMAEFLGAVRQIGYEISHGACVVPERVFISRITEILGCDEAYAKGMRHMFSLEPRDAFGHVPAGFGVADLYPWRFNRGMSYVRLPLIRRDEGDSAEIVWGNRHVEVCWKNLLSLCLTGRLKARSPGMRRFIGALRHRQGEEFNDLVADVARDELGLRVERRVKKLGKFRTQNLGDIDVLAADMGKRILKVIECKDLSTARTPHELANQAAALLHDRPGEPSILTRHQKRVDWVREHIDDAMELLGLASDERWTIESLLVVDEPLFTGHLQECPARILSIAEFRTVR